ncbi:hypothetical protein VPNG_00862 [Cytospora leucostoma]|uniref:Uncharacterized protein n=1 Tax=Cytospora leucostoma TaxID=1230097 RepID=A0A423XMS8_9PEZI|nr:hypothetical protein VPNG_00862 [Cytospora leucostoma]
MTEGQDAGNKSTEEDESTEEHPGDNLGHELQDQLALRDRLVRDNQIEDTKSRIALAYHDLGKDDLSKDRFTEAKENLEKALSYREEISRDSEWGYFNVVNAAKTRNILGHLCEAQGNFDEAREVRRDDRSNMVLCGNDDRSRHGELCKKNTAKIKSLVAEASGARATAEGLGDIGQAQTPAAQVPANLETSATGPVTEEKGENADTEGPSDIGQAQTPVAQVSANLETSEAGPATEKLENAETDAPVKKKKKKKKKKNVIVGVVEPGPSVENKKADSEPETTAKEEREDAQKAEALLGFNQPMDDPSPQIPPSESVEFETLKGESLEAEVRASGSPLQGHEEDTEQTEDSDATISADVTEVLLFSESQEPGGDDEIVPPAITEDEIFQEQPVETDARELSTLLQNKKDDGETRVTETALEVPAQPADILFSAEAREDDGIPRVRHPTRMVEGFQEGVILDDAKGKGLETEKIPLVSVTTSSPPETNIPTEEHDDDHKQPLQRPAPKDPKTAKKTAEKGHHRKQAMQISYQKWAQFNKPKKSQPIKAKPEKPGSASVPSTKALQESSKLPPKNLDVVETRPTEINIEDTGPSRVDDLVAMRSTPVSGPEKTSDSQGRDPVASGSPLARYHTELSKYYTQAQHGTNLPAATSQKDDSMSHGNVLVESGALDVTENQSDTSHKDTTTPVTVHVPATTGPRDDNDGKEYSPAMTVIHTTPQQERNDMNHRLTIKHNNRRQYGPKANTCHRKKDTCHRKKDTCHRKKDTCHRKKDTCHRKKDTCHRKKDTCHRKKDTCHRKKDTCHRKKDTRVTTKHSNQGRCGPKAETEQ